MLTSAKTSLLWRRSVQGTIAGLSNSASFAPVSRDRPQWFIHVRLLVAYLTRYSGPFPQSLPTPALNRHDTAAEWHLRPVRQPRGTNSITGPPPVRVGSAYILLTSLSGHTWVA